MFHSTMILFLSDNGACQEGGMLGRGEFFDIEKRNLEHANSYGEAWANAGNTPFRLYKHYVHEGGSATPFFIHWPAGIAARAEWYRSPGQIHDVMPTILDVAGAAYPATAHGNRLPPLEGVSLRPAFDGAPLDRKAPIVFEHQGNAAIRDDTWKLVGLNVALQGGVNRARWELYNMADDRTETDNLAAGHPDKVETLAAAWNDWAERVNVYPKGDLGPPPPPDPDPPQVQGRAFTIRATVEGECLRGIVLAHGGNAFGYALYFDAEGRPSFAYRNQRELTTVAANAPASGKVELSVAVDERHITLSVDGETAASARSPGLLAEQPGLGLFIGAGGPHPVGAYEGRHRFRGRIHRHEILVAVPKDSIRTP
jgi:hypothetical protein